MRSRMKQPLLKNAFAAAIAAFFAGSGLAAYATQAGEPLGPASLVFPEQFPRQTTPAVARAASGNAIVVWSDGNTGAIYGRRFAPDGAPLDGGFAISSSVTGRQQNRLPDVAMAPDGSFIVTWEFDDLSVSSSGSSLRRVARVMVRRFAADGTATSSAFSIAAPAQVDDSTPAVAVDAVGDFVIAFSRDRNSLVVDNLAAQITRRQIVVQRFAADGMARGEPINAGSPAAIAVTEDLPLYLDASTVPDSRIDVAMDSDGDFVLAWAGGVSVATGADFQYGYAGSVNTGIFLAAGAFVMRRYDSSGRPRGLPRLIDANAQSVLLRSVRQRLHSQPKVALDEDGDGVVAWSDRTYDGTRSDSTPTRIRALRFDANGNSKGSPQTYAQSTGYLTPVDVAANAVGDFVLAWATPAEQFVRRVGGDGTARGDVITVNTDPRVSVQGTIAVATDPVGNFDVVWTEVVPMRFFSPLSVFVRKYAGP